jgi:diguanylate cyclase (GGDEF)-like protein
MIDIDHFKHINDRFGHPAGDAALIALTRLMHNLLPTFRDADSAMFARLGGEEFVVLLPGIGKSRATGIAEKLRLAIGRLQVSTPAGHLQFTVSVGAATFHPDDDGFDGLLKRADAALYLAKQAGRNKVVTA